MKPASRGVVSFIACVAFIVLLSATVSAANEVFVVSADRNGDANYMVSHGDGSFSSQENLLLMSEDGLHPMGQSGIDYYSYGNGMGDFDNDGDFDYIIGDGFGGGDIFLFEKIGSGNQFASPVVVSGWSTGYFPMDMAVADFDGDGNFDFVMSYYFSNNCGLYLGDGALGFTVPGILENAAPNSSAGADAADFNNDGHADFVIASKSADEPFFVNLNDVDGEGNFTTHIFEGLKDADGYYVPYYGVAAADFNRDGNVDIAAATDGYLDIYKGNGEGQFEWLASYEYDLSLSSALDNYDFNGDGIQDLVAANFGSDGAAVAILLGKVDGSFADPVIYGGGTGGERNAVSAPPSPELNSELNKEPVAVIDPIYYEVAVGEEIVFDGSLSKDDDGQIVSYAWDFDDGISIDGATTALSLSTTSGNTDQSQPSHIYYEARKYKVRLTVTDNKGATGFVEAEVIALPVAARIKFNPYTLYLDSKAKWIWATIRLPFGYDARKIDDPSVCIVLEDGSSTSICADSDYGHGFLAKLRKRLYRKKRALTVRFDRQNFIDLIQKNKIPSGKITLMVQGVVLDNGAWVGFEGSGKIRTIERKKKGNFFSRYWKRHFKHFSKKCRSTYRR